ncbi:MAG TPA: RagB/SusD family nutrient uptake outer membrane protein [Mucilaginibacter sp.]|jgi:hypothetical protein
MKKIYVIITAAGIASLLSAGCKKVLLKQDLGNFTAPQVYNDSTVTTLSLNYIYSQNQPGWFGNSGGTLGGSYGSLTDEQYGDNAYVKGTVTNENVTDIGSSATSGNYFKIRTINMFIRDVNAGTLAADVKKRFAAQAYFWRAYRYFELVKLYGGVPLVLTPLAAVGQEAKTAAALPRNTTTQTFAQIVSDLDSCIKNLPARWPNNGDYGRITSGAAAAFLGRVLVTYASPQFNPSNDQTRWQAAYDANTNAISILSANGFGLYPKWDYTMWTTEGSAGGSTPRNPEAVLVTEYNTDNSTNQNGQNNETYDNSTRPKYLSVSGGSNQPTWDLAKAFPMKDGKDTLTSTYPYSAQTFFDNRDPRFYQTIAYNGCIWPLSGNSTYRLWTYYYYTSSSKTASTESSASSTGLYLRKGIDPSLTVANIAYAGTDWIEIRYAELLLNQAEAAAEIGNSATAYANLIAIRTRAGIEAGTDGLYGLTANMGHDQMITAIMNERQVELAFEGKRFWDLRRRKLLESTLNGKRRQAVVILLNKNGSNKDYISTTRDAAAAASLDALYATSFTVTTKSLDTYNIAYQPEDYFFGIPTASLQNNINLQQNNTWGGPFDPLK